MQAYVTNSGIIVNLDKVKTIYQDVIKYDDDSQINITDKDYDYLLEQIYFGNKGFENSFGWFSVEKINKWKENRRKPITNKTSDMTINTELI